jgi:hypothetical protein
MIGRSHGAGDAQVLSRLEWREIMMRTWPSFVTHLVSSLLIVGCTGVCNKSRESMDPEEVVEAYLDIALNFRDLSQKDDLMEYATGELEASLAEAPNDVITETYINKTYDLKNFSIVERRDRTPRETEITFQLAYQEGSPSELVDGSALITTENTVFVVKDKNRWSIREVVGNRTSFDFPVSALSRVTPRAPGEGTGNPPTVDPFEDSENAALP